MLTLFGKLWSGITAIPGLILPFLAKATHWRGMRPWVRWTLHVIFIAGLLVLLTFINYWLDLEKVLESPWPILRKVWLPILFLLVYALAWLGWYLWELLNAAEETSVFPDIDAAWKEGMQALDKAGIDALETPIFLVLGKPLGSGEGLFNAAQVPLQVRQVPRRPDAPIHIWANRDAIYVSCPGVTLLGKLATILAEEIGVPAPAAEPAPAPEPKEADPADAPVFDLTGPLLSLQAAPAPAVAKTESSPRRSLAESAMIPVPGQTQAAARRRPSLLKNNEAVELADARLRHLCRLVLQARYPYCPVNGILLLVPWAATATDREAQQAGRIAQKDLTSVHEVLHTDCPVVTLVTDLERVPGFREVVARLPDKLRHLRMGLGFPLVPDLEPAAVPPMYAGGIRWMCETLVPTLVYKLFRLDAAPAQRKTDVAGNIHLYQFLCELRAREDRLAGLLARAVEREPQGFWMLAGCYLASTGRDQTREQAFVSGVFPLLVDNQNFVSWTREALTEDTAFRRWTSFGYIGLGIFSAALLTLGYIFRPWR